jgi:hypothetical protein
MELKKFGFLAYQLCYLQPSSVILYVFFCCIYAKEFCLQAHDVHGDDKIEEVSSADKSGVGKGNIQDCAFMSWRFILMVGKSSVACMPFKGELLASFKF